MPGLLDFMQATENKVGLLNRKRGEDTLNF